MLNIHYTIPFQFAKSTVPIDVKFRQTLEVFDQLKEAGYRPAGMAQFIITMDRGPFSKLVRDHGNKCLVTETKTHRISAVYIGLVEISYTECKTDSNWDLQEDWKPLC